MTATVTARLALLSAALLLVPSLHAQTEPAPVAALQNAGKPGGSPAPLSRQQNEVEKVVLAQEKAWNAGDLDGFASAYKDSPDTLFISRSVNRGFAQMLASYKHNYPSRDAMGTLSYSELETYPLDANFMVVIGKYHLERIKKAGGNADGNFSLIFEKTPKGWKIILDHTT